MSRDDDLEFRDEPEPSREVAFDYPSAWFDLAEISNKSFCRSIEFHRDCESTNNSALQEANVESLPKLFLTDCQTAGRGRGANQWWAKEGALTFSVLVDPAGWLIAKTDWPRVSLATAIAVRDTLATLAPSCEIGLKWPNDVHLNQRKVCGILVEPSRSLAQALVIGVGVNVMNSLSEAPREIKGLATSLVDETDAEFALTDVLLTFLSCLETRLKELGSGALPLQQVWAEHCVLSGKRIVLRAGDQDVTGRCLGLADSGAILVERNGETKAWFGGVVRFVD